MLTNYLDTSTDPKPANADSKSTPSSLEKPVISSCTAAVKKPTTSSFGSLKGPVSSKKQSIPVTPAPWPKLYQMNVTGLKESSELSLIPAYTDEFSFFGPIKQSIPVYDIPKSDTILCKFYDRVLDSHILDGKFISKQQRDPQSFLIPPVRASRLTKFTSNDLANIISMTVTNPISLTVLDSLLQKIPFERSAFESHTHETKNWVQKYEPLTASSVVTANFQAVNVRNWLIHRLKALGSGKPIGEVRGKRKRKSARKVVSSDSLEGFIVDDEEEIEYVTSSDSPSTPNYNNDNNDVSMTDINSDNIDIESFHVRQPEILILYGSPGSGKTSSVYAACKELGIFVFELNSSDQRTGKVAMDKLEGMSSSHLVHSNKNKDGFGIHTQKKNGLFNFIQRKKTSSETSSPIISAAASRDQSPDDPNLNKKSKHQKSVVLLDEADVLFDHESSFWPAIVSKFLTSTRRPVIITCSDPNRLSKDILSKYDDGFMEFRHADSDVQADALWSIALAEGHLLDRKAVLQLIQECDQDFRKALNQLQFWCQMAIGDRQSGIHWLMKTKELSREQNTRYISENTFIGVEVQGGTYSKNSSLDLTDSDLEIYSKSSSAKSFDALNSFGMQPNLCSFPPTSRDEHHNELLRDLDLKPCVTTEGLKSVSLDTWGRLSDALSCADIIKSKTCSQFSVPDIYENLDAVAEEADELPVPSDYIIGDGYSSDVNTLITQKFTEPLSFEKVHYPDIVKTAYKMALDVSTATFSNEASELPAIAFFPASSPNLCARSTVNDIRESLYGLSLSSGSYSWITHVAYTSINASSPAILSTELAPFIRAIARGDVRRQEMVEAVKRKYLDDQLRAQTEALRWAHRGKEDGDDDSILPDIAGGSQVLGALALPIETSTGMTHVSKHNSYPLNINLSQDTITGDSPQQVASASSSFDQLAQRNSSRTTMRAAYASVGHSAAEVMAATRRYLQENIELDEVIKTAPICCRNCTNDPSQVAISALMELDHILARRKVEERMAEEKRDLIETN